MSPSAKVAKLPAAVARSGMTGSPALSPQLLPRRPAFVLLAHPALKPGRDSRISVPAWGAAGGRSLPAPGALCPPVAVQPLASRAGDQRLGSLSGPATGAPLRALGPAAARSSPGGLPPSLGELGAGLRACAAGAPRPAGRGAGNGSLSFPGSGLSFLPTLLPHSGEKLGFTFPELHGRSPVTPPT